MYMKVDRGWGYNSDEMIRVIAVSCCDAMKESFGKCPLNGGPYSSKLASLSWRKYT